jgi:integrase
MQSRLTQAFVDRAQAAPDAERTIYWDKTLPGFGLMVRTSSGHKSFVFQYRSGHASRRMNLDGKFLRYEAEREKKAGLKVARRERRVESAAETARLEAMLVKGAVTGGRDPLKELRAAKGSATDSFRSIAEEYLKREERGGKLRSLNQRRAMLDRLIYPIIGTKPIGEIRRSDIVRLLDKIEEGALTWKGKRIKGGPVMADRALATVRRVMNWHAGRSDDFRSPIVRGMARTKSKERARERTLTDDELRAVWRATDGDRGPFGPFVQFLLLTGARRSEAAAIARSELNGADWTLPGTRNKTKVDLVRPLSAAALVSLGRLPKIGQGDLIFTPDGKRPLRSFGKSKRKLDKAILQDLRKADPEAKPLPRWTLHDLRRTARSLMSRAGVPSDHAERSLGHVMPGIRGTYDRHEYHEEKRRAFEALAAQIERILYPQQNVIPLRG